MTVIREETLDPEDWDDTARQAHAALEEAIAYLRDVRQRPPWQQMPEQIRDRFEEPLPWEPQPLQEVLRSFTESILPYPMGNVHPRFWAWYMGAGNLTGALADFLGIR